MSIKVDVYEGIICPWNVGWKPHGCFGKDCLEFETCKHPPLVKKREYYTRKGRK